MIYFFDNELNMVKVATSKNVISAVHEHELNGLILGTVEADLSYTEAFINDVDYFGYYYKDNYYLHKIKRVEHEHENELVRITGRHIFFEDMIYGDYIRDVRPVNRDALYILNQTISANTRWQTVMTDTSKVHTTNYYWVPPMEVLNDLTENVGIEYEPKILFDGQNINGFQLHVANRIGEDTPIRVPFGSRVLNLKYEVDYSEIVTALYGHGKGEEVGDGYGRRINFRDVDFSRNGVVSRPGSLFMENPSVTAQYGKDDGSPKFGRIIFEDIESASELANATYEAYLEQSRPKMLFEASVVDLGDVGMGDGVLIIRREYDVYFNARIHKLMVDLLDAENADVELGDYAHFKESKVQRKTRENNNQYRRETSSRIQQLKEQFNDRFDGEVNQMREDFEQALIDAHAEIQAAEQRMEALITTTRNDWTDTFEAEVAEIYRKANEDYNRIETEITGVINSTRNDMETQFNDSVQSTRAYAEQQAQERADAVQSNLESTTSEHQGMIDELFDNVVDFNQFKTDINVDVSGLQSKVIDFDAFLGDMSDITLDERLQSINRNFEERIRNVDSNTYNMLRGSRFDESGMWDSQSTVVLMNDEDINYYRLGLGSSNVPYILYMRESTFEADTPYILSVDYRTEEIPELDFVTVRTSDGDIFLNDLSEDNTVHELVMDGQWTRLIVRFTPSETITGQIFIGTNFFSGDTTRGVIDIRLPYLTSSNNTQWVYHPLDATQSISEVTRRITNLEDGRNELITRTEWDSESDYIMQTVRDIEETVDISRNRIQEIEDYEIIQRGSEAIQTVDGFLDKVWLNDFSEIGANLIPQSANAWEVGGIWTTGNLSNETDRIRLKEPIPIDEGQQYTFADYSVALSRISSIRIYVYKDGEYQMHRTVNRGESVTFTATGNEVRLSFVPLSGFSIGTGMIEHRENRVQMKLERGSATTPMLNALSRVEQLADSVSIAVAEIDGSYVTQSQFNITSDEVNTLVSKTDGHDTQIGNLSVSYDQISATVVNINEDVESYGTWINQTDDLITSKVWMNDVADINANLIPFTDFTVSGNSDFWTRYGSNAFAVTNDGYYRARNTNSTSFISIQTPSFDVVEGQEYTVSFKGNMSSNIGRTNFDRTYNLGAGVGSISAGIAYHQGDGVYRYRFTAKGTGSQSVVIGVWTPSGRDVSIYIKEVKVEEGSVMTPYMRAMSVVEQMANEIRLAVQGIDGYGYLTQSDIQVRPGYVQLGSQRLGDDELASIIRVSPDTIDAIASEMRLSGDLLVEGEITALAVKAIEGEFASLWADEFRAITIDVEDIQGITAEFERMYILNANIEKLVSQNVFADGVTALVGDFVDVNAGNIVTSGLSANIIESSHIQSSNATINKLFSNSARIDTLISKTHFVNEIKATSIDAIYADLRSVNSEIMTSNIIKSNWLDVDTALFNRFTASSAFISSLTSKSAFIRDIQAIEITANQLNLTTLTNRINQIEGGLRIKRPDGVDWVRNGQARGHVPVQVSDGYAGAGVRFNGTNFITGSSFYQTMKYFYTPHEGTRLRVVFAVGLFSGPSSAEFMHVRVRGFSGYNPINMGTGTSTQHVRVISGETNYVTFDIPMAPPNYSEFSAYLEFRRDPDGQHSDNEVYARLLHIGQYD